MSEVGIHQQIHQLAEAMDLMEANIKMLVDRVNKLEDRLDALISVVEEIVYSRWCEGKVTKGDGLVLGGSLRDDLGLWSEEKMTKWERGEGLSELKERLIQRILTVQEWRRRGIKDGRPMDWQHGYITGLEWALGFIEPGEGRGRSAKAGDRRGSKLVSRHMGQPR